MKTNYSAAWARPVARLMAVAHLVACLSCVGFVAAPVPGYAGGFLGIETSIFADETAILHPFFYTGTSNATTVRVCIDPSTQNANKMIGPVIRAISTINGLAPTLGNTSADGTVPSTAVDFESIALHELLHCAIGLTHSNVGIALGVTGLAQFSTNSTVGPNGSYDVNLGPDGVPGSLDDPRGDDENRFWFSKSSNNPFVITSPVSSATYSQDVADLPTGHSFAANGSRVLSIVLGLLETEAVMSTPQFQGEMRRELSPDEVAIIRYARAGLDENAGTSDDYSTAVIFAGLSSGSGCQVVLRFAEIPSPGQCQASSIAINSNGHFRLAGTATVSFDSSAVWHFSDPVFSDGFESGDLSAWVAFP
ncbi:MAG: hypothetical protein HC897_09475 [Thermoanaerobaculia bacterium]|nr:hypothetical protein [Thermoanaerobaculia bacterium]